MRSLHRTQLDEALRPFFDALPPLDKVLDIGGGQNNPYAKWIRAKSYQVLDPDASTHPDIVGDVHKLKIRSNTYDLILATEVLEHCHTPTLALHEMHRVLKKGGILIGSVPFMYPDHREGAMRDYYRFSKDGVEHLLTPFRVKKIQTFGTVLTPLATILGKKFRYAKILNPILAKMDSHSHYAGVAFWAQK